MLDLIQTRSRSAAVVALIVLAAALSGCGAGNDGSGATEIDKATFVRKADQLCNKTHRAIVKDGLRAIRESIQAGRSRHEAETGVVANLLIPSLEAEIDGIRGLGFPAGDEEEIEPILAAIEGAIDEARREPETYIQAGNDYKSGSVHFGDANNLARAYGLEICPVG